MLSPAEIIDHHTLTFDPGDKRTKKLTGFFTGAIMKATQGKADGKVLNELMTKLAQR